MALHHPFEQETSSGMLARLGLSRSVYQSLVTRSIQVSLMPPGVPIVLESDLILSGFCLFIRTFSLQVRRPALDLEQCEHFAFAMTMLSGINDPFLPSFAHPSLLKVMTEGTIWIRLLFHFICRRSTSTRACIDQKKLMIGDRLTCTALAN